VFGKAMLIFVGLSLLTSRGLAADLPEPPGGYSWKHVSEIKGVFLVPESWHYFQKHEGNTFALFITKESIAATGEFQTGMSINALLHTPTAPAQVKRMVESVAMKYGSQVSTSVQEPFVRFTTHFDSPKPPTQKLIRTVMIGVANAHTSTSYLVSFECPVSDWKNQWSIGEVLVNTLGFESEL
jgi:hypothetical protein